MAGSAPAIVQPSPHTPLGGRIDPLRSARPRAGSDSLGTARPVPGDAGKRSPVGRGVAEPRDIERRRSASERRFAAVFRSIPAMVAIHSLEAGRVLDVNDAFLGTLGYAEEEVLGHTLSELETWVDPEAGDRMAATLASGGAVRGQEAHLRTRGGGILDGVLSAEMVTIVGRSHILWVFTDLTENRRAEDAVHRELEHRAFHDSLTGLPNRALFRNRVEHVHERLAQSSSLYAVLLFDIDGFTTVNESIGHDRGDEVLR